MHPINKLVLPAICLAQAENMPSPLILNGVHKTLKGSWVPEHPSPSDASVTIPGACRFRVFLKQGEKPVRGRRISEIVENKSDGICEAMFEVGEPAGPIPKGPIMINPNKGVTPLTATYTTSTAYFSNWYQDPLEIILNSVGTTIMYSWPSDWGYPDPSFRPCVTDLGGTEITTAYWDPPIGWWYTVSNNWWDGSVACQYAEIDAAPLFENDVFGLQTTWVSYATVIQAVMSGGAWFIWSDRVWGTGDAWQLISGPYIEYGITNWY
jgi:hypothetical protein